MWTGIAIYIWLMSASVGAIDSSTWTLHITNDNCPDYTWGYPQEQTRQAFADIVRAHLDEMNRTDTQESANRDRYNMAVTQEALCFLERYPEREAELVRRIKEGRILVSPFLCNSLWAFHSAEGTLRTLYPAHRLEQKWEVSFDVAEHIEEPSLPWGMAPILAGAGIRWLSVPFYNYDSTFSQLTNPPLFILEGPDGSRLRVILDPWASNKASYTQGASVLRDSESITKEWLPHYQSLGEVYPLRCILASGTHGDIAPQSGAQARGFADAIIQYNAGSPPHPKLVNATVAQFCEAVDRAQAERAFLPTQRGCFGHSWDVWPVSLAKYAADLRQAERLYLAAETLLVVAASDRPELRNATRKDRERAEWCWSMLSDHAWNGSNDQNKRHNAELRRDWSAEFAGLAEKLLGQGWAAAGLTPETQTVTTFNSLSFPRKGFVRIPVTQEVNAVVAKDRPISCQVVSEGKERILYFVSPVVPAFSFERFQLRSGVDTAAKADGLSASTTGLESRYYHLTIDARTGGVASLVHKTSSQELGVPGARGICQTLYFDGQEHVLQNVRTEVIASGPVLARVKVTGTVDGLEVANYITVYDELDQVDFDLHVHKPVTTREQRLCQVFPVAASRSELRLETPGAVLRPRPQPQGDLLPGADPRRFAVQGFVDSSVRGGAGVTIVPLDAFLLRLDLEPLTFEALGNDQNYREVTQDQDGVEDFRFRYVLRAHTGDYRNRETVAWSRSVATPLLSIPGVVPEEHEISLGVRLDPARAVALCLKPADGDASGGFILRFWEIAGNSAPLRVALGGCRRAVRTDLLERNQDELPITDGFVETRVNPYGFGAIRLLP